MCSVNVPEMAKMKADPGATGELMRTSSRENPGAPGGVLWLPLQLCASTSLGRLPEEDRLFWAKDPWARMAQKMEMEMRDVERRFGNGCGIGWEWLGKEWEGVGRVLGEGRGRHCGCGCGCGFVLFRFVVVFECVKFLKEFLVWLGL